MKLKRSNTIYISLGILGIILMISSIVLLFARGIRSQQAATSEQLPTINASEGELLIQIAGASTPQGRNDVESKWTVTPPPLTISETTGVNQGLAVITAENAKHLVPVATLGNGVISIGNLTWSPDGKLVIVPCARGVSIYNTVDPEAPPMLLGAPLGVRSTAVSPDGTILAAGGISPGTVYLWDISTKGLLRILQGHRRGARSLAFSPDGLTLASGDVNTIRLWEVGSGALVAEWGGAFNDVESLAFSPGGEILASGNGDGTVRLWDVKSHKQLAVFSGDGESRHNSVAFSPDGELIASGDDNGNIAVRDINTQEVVRQFQDENEHPITSVSFSPDSKRLISSGRGWHAVRLWSIESGEEVAVLEGHRDNRIEGVAFSPDGHRIASMDKVSVIVWDAHALTKELEFSDHDNRILNIVFSPNGATLASSSDSNARLWNMDTHDVAGGVPLGSYGAAISPNASRFAVNSRDGIMVWDLRTGQMLKLLSDRGMSRVMAFSSDGKRLVAGTLAVNRSGTIELWDLESQDRPLASFDGHSGGIVTLAINPTGTLLASAGSDGAMRVWSTETGNEVALFPGVGSESLAFSSDGTMLASANNDGTVQVWNASTMKQLLFLSHSERLLDISFSPDGTLLLAGSQDGKALLWDIHSGTQLASLPILDGWGGWGGVWSVAFSPDSVFLATGGNEGIIYLWAIPQ